jgi:phage baseplate assembly protein gpV
MRKGLFLLLRFVPAIVAAFAISSCEIINPSEEIPVYFKVNQASMVIDSNTGLSSSTGLKDIWISQGTGLQGVYPLPAVVPILMKNGTNFRLDAGIFETGQSSYRITYPFLKPIYFDSNPAPGDTVELTPVFQYFDDTQLDFRIDERFENADINLRPFVVAATDTVNVRKTTTEVFMGDYSGHVHFDGTHKYLSVISNSPDPMVIEKNKDVYAEITYKTSVPFTIGLAFKSSSGTENGTTPVLTTDTTSTWNTVFVHLAQQVRANNLPDVNYHLWITADGQGETGDLYLDNIRFIQFK